MRVQGLELVPTLARFKGEICYGDGYLYAACGARRPSVVVETGVRRGSSTAFILKALHDNGAGHLYSIDLPNVIVDGDASNVLPKRKGTGHLAPERLSRDRWSLIIGDAREELPRLLDRLDSVDIFHHDSIHTYDHMRFEFGSVRRKLEEDGFILGDDAACNPAFVDHCAERGARGTIVGDAGIAFNAADAKPQADACRGSSRPR